MGLDMYAYTTRTIVTQEVGFEIEESQCELLHQWRKHPNLHGIMKVLYQRKGGKDPDFNCSNVALNLNDFRILEEFILQDALPNIGGFFFGASDGSEKSDDLEFIGNARSAIHTGLFVFYNAWW